MMLSKLGALESAQATEYLTAILNGFKLEAEDAASVVDRLISIDNIAATSAGEMATAMQYGSAVANEVGVSFNTLAAIIGTVSSVTRLSAEMIGTAFRTMFIRMQSVKAGEIDETGQSLNNVEKTLSRIGVALRDDTDSFRPLEDVIADVAKVWGELDEVTRSQISGAVAGQRQAQMFAVLMQNYGDVAKYVAAETESLGLATDRYTIYLKGVEAAQDRVTASWEKLVQSLISSGAVAGFYDAAAGALTFVDAVGGIPTVLAIATVAMVAFNKAAIVAFASNPITMWVAAISVAVMAIGYLINGVDSTNEKLQKLNAAIENSNSKISELRNKASSIRSLSDEYENLKEKEKLSSDEAQRLLDVQNQLKGLVPILSGHFDEYGNFILDASNDMASLNDETREQIRLEKELLQLKTDEKANVAARSLLDAQKRKESFGKGAGYRGLSREELEQGRIQVQLDWANALKESKASFSQMSRDAKIAFIRELGDSSLAEEFGKILRDSMIGGLSPNERDESKIESSAKDTALLAFESFSAELEKLVSDDDTINKLFEKSITEGLDFSDIKTIPEAYSNALYIEGDKLKLNIDLVRELQLVEAGRSLAAIKQAYDRQDATAQEVAVIQLYYNRLKEVAYLTVNGMKVTAGAFKELAWNIANDAAMSGNSFVDLQNKALTSAESIYNYLTSGDAAFNNFIQQAANATGKSVQELTNVINGMLAQSYNNALGYIQAISRLSSYYMSEKGVSPSATPYTPMFTPAPTGYQYPGGLEDMYKGGGGNERERKEAERLRKIEQDIANARKDAVDRLKHQLSIFKDITSERKKQLDLAADEREYGQDVEEKNKEILKIQTELNALQFDDSEEANARRLALQDELSNLSKELSNIQYDQSIEQQKNAIDREYEAFQTSIDNAIREIEHISTGSVGGFASQLAAILSQMSIPTFHEGGMVGSSGTSVKGNEVLAKLLSGEVVSTQEQGEKFIRNTLPQLIQGASTINGANIDVSIPIQVMGNLDRAALPGLEKMIEAAVKRLNDNLYSRGYTRRAEAFGN